MKAVINLELRDEDVRGIGTDGDPETGATVLHTEDGSSVVLDNRTLARIAAVWDSVREHLNLGKVQP